MKAKPTVEPRPPHRKNPDEPRAIDFELEEIAGAADHAVALINAAATVAGATRLEHGGRGRTISLICVAEEAAREVSELVADLRKQVKR